QSHRERHGRAIHPSLARRAAGAGRAGDGLAHAPSGDAGRRWDGPDPARPRRRHNPERRQHRARDPSPSRCSASADTFDRGAPSGDGFSAAPAVGYGRGMTGRPDWRSRSLLATTAVAIAIAATVAFLTIDAPPLPARRAKAPTVVTAQIA